MLHHGTSLPWAVRAVQLDLARQMETVDFICRYADFAAAQEYNTLVLYLEARIRTATFPYRALDETYSLAEMATIVEHAHSVGVQVVPVIPSLGHAEQFFSCRELQHLAEEREGKPTRLGGTSCSTFCPSLDETYDFLSQYYRELAAVFTDPYFHIGCDEAWNFGYCTRCHAVCREQGMGPLFTRHLQRMHDLCQAVGKRVWLWDDMYEFFPEEVRQAPRDVVMCHWVYDEVVDLEGARSHFANRWRYNWLAEYERAGIEAIVCPWTRPP
ncbi:MAG TPA: family 20 glycosylhydrolase, partial [Armatimonadota bacterium]